MDRAVVEIPRHKAADIAVAVGDQIEREVFDEELDLVLQRLLVQRVQHRVPGPVGGGAGPLRGALAVMRGHAAERPLIDPALLGAAERHAVMFQLDDRRDRLAAHVFDGVLVAQPVGALDGVVHVPAPVVLAHVAERGGDAALRRNGVAAGRKNLGDAGRLQPGLGHAEGRAQPRAAGADDDDVIFVVGDWICLTHFYCHPICCEHCAFI